LALLTTLLVGLLLPAIPARAIYGSDPIPGGKYPYVGGVWLRWNCCLNDQNFEMPNPPNYPFFDDDPDAVPNPNPGFLEGPKVRANGILIASNVVLTNGAHFRNGRRVGVSFKKQLGDIDPNNDAEFDVGADGVYEGYVYHMPGLNRDKRGNVVNDLAVVILDDDVDPDDHGGVFAPLPALGGLNKLKGTRLTAISYGPQNEAPYDPADEDKPTVEEILAPFVEWDFTRRRSAWDVGSVEKARLRLLAPEPSYYCDADQGAPFVDDKTGIVTSLMTFWPQYCNDAVAYGYRLDTRDVRDFLCAVGNDDLLDIEDPNNNVGPSPGFDDLVPYATPDGGLQSFCDDVSAQRATAAADDGDQSADRQQNGNGKHKKGKQHGSKGKRGR
jgi:hypothetical protein